MLHMPNKKITLFAAIVFCLGTYAVKYFYIPVNVQPTENQIVKNDQNNMYEQLKQELNNQEQSVWDLLQTDTGISKEECLEKQKKNSASYKRLQKKRQRYARCLYKKLKAETIHFVQEVLQDFGLNPTDIQIVPSSEQSPSAIANDSTIFINEKKFTQHSLEPRRFIIAHEIAHLLVQDDSIFRSLYMLANRKKTSPQKMKAALDAFCRFREIRADINALLEGGEKYVSGAFESFRKLQELTGGDNPGITHPKTSDRIKTAQHICSKMGWKSSQNPVTLL